MLDLLLDKLHDPRFLAMILAAIAAIATVVTLGMPLLAGDTLDKRMKAVALEREKMRQRERERMARNEKVSLRTSKRRATSSCRQAIAVRARMWHSCSSAWSRRWP
jgi:tight adherence protein C